VSAATRLPASFSKADTASEALEANIPTIERLRKRAAAEGVEAAIGDRPRPPRDGKLDGTEEARLTALACSEWEGERLVTGGDLGITDNHTGIVSHTRLLCKQ